MSDKLNNIAAIVALPAGTEQNVSWINGGVLGTCRELTPKQSKAKQTYWAVKLSDPSGHPLIETVLFTPVPGFAVNDVVQILGKGLRRTEYNGNPQIALSKNAVITVVAGGQVSGGATSQPAPQSASNGPRTAPERPLDYMDGPPRRSTQVGPLTVNGATVGMALKAALDLHARNVVPPYGKNFWDDVEATAQQIIAMSARLEHPDDSLPF